MTTFKVEDSYLCMNVKEREYLGKLEDGKTVFSWRVNPTDKKVKLYINHNYILTLEKVCVEKDDSRIVVRTEDGQEVATLVL